MSINGWVPEFELQRDCSYCGTRMHRESLPPVFEIAVRFTCEYCGLIEKVVYADRLGELVPTQVKQEF